MKLSEVFEGWKNHLAPADFLKEQINKAHKERMDICRSCPHNSINDKNANIFRVDEHCTHCGCSLAPKTKCLSCSCPLNKWGSIISSEEELIIEKDEKII